MTMGEVTEMLLDGTLCEGCGEVFDDVIEGAEAPGHPRRCPSCRPACEAPKRKAAPGSLAERLPQACGSCQRRFRTINDLKQHTRDAHQTKSETRGTK